MAHETLTVWALPLAGAAVPLPDLRNWTISPTDGDWGSVEIHYPRNGRNADLLLALAGSDIDLRVELTVRDTDGRRWVKPALLLESSTDDVAEGGEITVHGHFHEYELGEVVVPYAPGQPNGETAVAGNAGQMLIPLLQAAQGRGCLAGITWTFTTAADSTGKPWSKTSNLKLSPGQNYAAVLGTLTGYGLSEWELTNTRELRLYDGEDGKGVDRTTGPTPLTLERGRDLNDAPRKHTLLGAATALVAAGKDGIYSLFSDATAQARRGRRIEQYASFGNAADQGTLNALTLARLGTLTAGRLELSHKLALGPGRPTPLLDFGPSDYVFSATRAGVVRRRVRQVTLKGTADAVTEADVTVGAVIDEWAVRQQKRIDDLASGAAVVGTSTPAPAVDDGATPAAPGGLVASSLWYPTNEGVGLASITAVWTASAGTAASPVEGYIVEWHYVDTALGTAWQQLPQTAATTLSWSGVNPGEGVEVRVRAVNKWARTSPTSAPYPLTTELDGTPPPVLPAPVGTAYLGLLKFDWNGKGAAGEVMPGDFLEAELHLSTTSNFTPNRPLLADGRTLDTAASTTYRDRLTGAGEMPVDPGGAYGVTWYAKWVPVDRSRNAAAASAQGSAVRTQAADGDVSALNVGKLVTGIMSALMTISGIIRTAISGARVELDTTGLRCIAASGRVLLEFNIPTSVLTIIGRLIAGPGVGVGSTIVIDPGPPPRLRMYPTATAQNTVIYGDTTLRPDGSTGAGFNIDTLNASGQTDGFAVDAWSTNVRIGHRLTSGAFAPGGWLQLQRIGGGVFLRVNATDGFSGATDQPLRMHRGGAQVSIDTDGGVFLGAAAGQELNTGTPVGSNGAGFNFLAQNGSPQGYRLVAAGGFLRFVENAGNAYLQDDRGGGAIKCFVIDHPTDPDRWLVHGCTEAPEAGVEYRGVVEVLGGRAVVDLPGYFEAATLAEGRTVHLTMLLPDDELAAELPDVDPPAPGGEAWVSPPPIPVPPIPESALLHPVAASVPRNGRFRIATSAPDGTRVAWLVKATRADVPALDVEPLRVDVEVAGFGPYRTIVEQGEAA